MAKINYVEKNKALVISVISAVALVLVGVLLFSVIFSGRGTVMSNGDLMSKVRVSRKGGEPDDEFKKVYSEFSLKLLKSSADTSENVAFSLVDAVSATALMAYSANGDTQVEIERALGTTGMKAGKSISGLQKRTAYSNKKGAGLKSANNLWLNNAALFGIKKSFLKTNGKYFGLGIYRESFADSKIVDSASTKISDATDGNTFSQVKFDQTQYMNLVSGASFVAKWKTQASSKNLSDNLFAGAQSEASCPFFTSVEDGYLNGTTYSGAVKAYEGGFSFVGLVPSYTKEGAVYTISEVLEELETSGGIANLKAGLINGKTEVILPDYSNSVNIPTTTDLSDALKEAGAEKLFTKSADLGSLAPKSQNLHLDSFSMAGDIQITPAGSCSSASEGKELTKKELSECKNSVEFNRSFLYFVVDDRSGLPIYAGILNKLD